MEPLKTLVLGANGQLGRALRDACAGDTSIEFATRAEFDLADPDAVAGRDWSAYGTVINAGAYTAVDQAETPDGRRAAWATNVAGVEALARVCAEHRVVLVHVSTDYVFDGTAAGPHSEDEPFSPLGVYGQTKAAGDAIVSGLARHYIVRTSWVVGEGNNFVRTMASLAARGIAPSVVNDQIGRLSFTTDIAAGIRHLLATGAPFGTYNLTNDGEPSSWADIAATVYEACGKPGSSVTGVTTEEYFRGRDAAPRPLNSVLDLDKIKVAGFAPQDQTDALAEYLTAL